MVMRTVSRENRPQIPEEENILQGVRLTLDLWLVSLLVFAFLKFGCLLRLAVAKVLAVMHASHIVEVTKAFVVFNTTHTLAGFVTEVAPSAAPVMVI